MITSGQIVKRFIDETRTCSNNQEAVNRVQAWLEREMAAVDDLGKKAELKAAADSAGQTILLLIAASNKMTADKSSSVLSAEALGTPGIVQGKPPEDVRCLMA